MILAWLCRFNMSKIKRDIDHKEFVDLHFVKSE